MTGAPRPTGLRGALPGGASNTQAMGGGMNGGTIPDGAGADKPRGRAAAAGYGGAERRPGRQPPRAEALAAAADGGER